MPDFDMKRFPFAIARDSVGLVLIDISKRKAFLLSSLSISVNLYGHGDILRLIGT